MVPLKLRLRNFMSYASDWTELDFSGLHLVSLVGENGHGKSALLDAMTWTLWGRSRVGARRDEELITLGRDEMEVDFEFALEGHSYRAVRRYTRGTSRRRGYGSLELSVRANGNFLPLTGNTIRETQGRIEELLHMDYDTFINSAFLVQGRADEFTTKPPAERKRILGEILGLSRYDELEERARDRAREEEARRVNAASHIAEIDRELGQRPRYEEELTSAEQKMAGIEAELAARQAELEDLRGKEGELLFLRSQLGQLGDQARSFRTEMERAREQAEEHEGRLSAGRQLMAQATEIEAGYALLLQAREENERLNQMLAHLLALSKERNDLERDIIQAEQELKLKRERVLAEVREEETRAQKTPALERELDDTRKQISALSGVEEELGRKRAQAKDLSEEMAAVGATNKNLKEDIRVLGEKLELLARAEARCPLCDSDLNPTVRRRVLDKHETEREEKSRGLHHNERRLQNLGAAVRELEQQAGELERTLARRGGLEERVKAVEKSLSEAREAEERAAQGRERLSELERKLAEGDFAHEEREKLAAVQGEMGPLGYSPEVHQEVRQKVAQLGHYEEDRARLEVARRSQEMEEKALKEAKEAEARWQSELETARAQMAQLSQEAAGLEEPVKKIPQVDREVNELRLAEAEAQRELGAAQERLARCDSLRVEREKWAAEERQASEERELYEELRLAFGKNGLQALLLEGVIPELEEEANQLLGRMTDGRMNLRFETQRETVEGRLVETLQIVIADEAGPRSYELYSGGEAFRVDFAIRVALSKLLARRAGARLETLIIDEGFGTQDAQGRERLVEAISSIRGDFQRIIVISHIEELREAFPARIEVVKTARGSQVSIV